MSDYEKLKKIYDEIDILIEKKVTFESPEFKAWKLKLDKLINKIYLPIDIEYININEVEYSSSSYNVSTMEYQLIEDCKKGLLEVKALLEVSLEELEDGEDNIVDVKEDIVNNKTYSKVFIVHGHDGELKEKVARLLLKQNIDAIILHEQVNNGTTIIEKIEKNSDVDCAICLFTADDEGKSKKDEHNKDRARQNVVFETGYFMGKLKRENVIIIANSDIEMPSDLQGVVYTNQNNWEVEILRGLKSIGYNIDMNNM